MQLIDHRYGRARMIEAHDRADRARHARRDAAQRRRPADRARLAAAQMLLRASRRLESRARGHPARARYP